MNTRKRLQRLILPVAALALLTDMVIGGLGAEADAVSELELASGNDAIGQEQTFTGVLASRTSAASRSEYRAPYAYEPIAVVVEPALPDVGAELASTGSTTGSTHDGISAEPVAVTVPGERAGTRMEIRTVTEPFERIEQRDANRFSDLAPLVVQAGRNGELTRVYRYADYVEAVGVPVLEIVAATRQDEIVTIGTRQRPAPAPFYGDTVTGGIPESVWVALAQCESGGRPNVISAGGRFHGLYQFSVATWRSVGGEGVAV